MGYSKKKFRQNTPRFHIFNEKISLKCTTFRPLALKSYSRVGQKSVNRLMTFPSHALLIKRLSLKTWKRFQNPQHFKITLELSIEMPCILMSFFSLKMCNLGRFPGNLSFDKQHNHQRSKSAKEWSVLMKNLIKIR